MKKKIDRMERVALTNALAILEQHGLIDHSNFFTEKGSNNEVWAYVIKRKSVRISQIDKTTYELEDISHE